MPNELIRPDQGPRTEQLARTVTLLSANLGSGLHERALNVDAAQDQLNSLHGSANQMLTRPTSHTMAELPHVAPGSINGDYCNITRDPHEHVVVGDEHGLLTRLLVHEPVQQIIHGNALEIHADPQKREKALSLIGGLLMALLNQPIRNNVEQNVEKQTIDGLGDLGYKVEADFKLKSLDVFFTSDRLAKFFKYPEIAELFQGLHAKEELTQLVIAILELNKGQSEYSNELKDFVRGMIIEKAASKGYQVITEQEFAQSQTQKRANEQAVIDASRREMGDYNQTVDLELDQGATSCALTFDADNQSFQAPPKQEKTIVLPDDPKDLLRMTCLSEVLQLLSLKSSADRIFKDLDGDQNNVGLLQRQIAKFTQPQNWFQGWQANRNPGGREAGLTARLCRVIYDDANASNPMLGFGIPGLSEDEIPAYTQDEYRKAFAAIGVPMNERQYYSVASELTSRTLAAVLMNNLVDGHQLLVGPKTVKYIFMASHIRKTGALTKREREEFAASLAYDLKQQDGVEPALVDALLKEFGPGRFTHFLTDRICEELQNLGAFSLANDNFREASLHATDSMRLYKRTMASASGHNYTPKEQAVAGWIISSLERVLQDDLCILNEIDVTKIPALSQIRKEILGIVAEGGHNFNLGTQEAEKLFDSLIQPVYDNVRFAVVGNLNLAYFLESIFPYAAKSANELSKDFDNRIAMLSKLEMMIGYFVDQAEKESKGEVLATTEFQARKPNSSYTMTRDDDAASSSRFNVSLRDVKAQILNELMATYDGVKPLEEFDYPELIPTPIKAGEIFSKKSFGQVFYKAIMDRFNLTSDQKSDLDDYFYSVSPAKRVSRRRAMGRVAAGGLGLAVAAAGGTAWVMNAPVPFYEKDSFTLQDLEIAYKNGDLQHKDAKPLAVMKDLIEELMEDNYSLQRRDLLSSPTVSKNDFVFSILPINNTAAFEHFKTGEFTYQERDSTGFIRKIKESFEDTIFKNLKLSDEEKTAFATRAMNRYHDLLDNYSEKNIAMSDRKIPPALHPILMENPDPKKNNLIPIVFVDSNYANSIALGASSEELYGSIDMSLRAFERHLQVSYNSYKVDETKQHNINIAEDPDLESKLKIIMDYADRRSIFSRLASRASYNKVKEVFKKYLKNQKS